MIDGQKEADGLLKKFGFSAAERKQYFKTLVDQGTVENLACKKCESLKEASEKQCFMSANQPMCQWGDM
jgi:hypothetical protein